MSQNVFREVVFTNAKVFVLIGEEMKPSDEEAGILECWKKSNDGITVIVADPH